MDSEKEYITKQYVYSVLEKMRKINNKNQGGLISDTVEVCIRCVSDNIRLAHEEDVAPVRHGQWIISRTDRAWNGAEYPTHCKCNQCGREIPYLDMDSYCPTCGAKRDKDGDGE